MRILIAEDNQLVREFLMRALLNLAPPCTLVTETTNKDQAVALIREGKIYSHILSDLNMPGAWDGLELIAIARERLPQAHMALMSGNITEEIEHLARIAGG